MRINLNKPIPKEWESRKSISAQEFNDFINGKHKPKEAKVHNGPKIRINPLQDFAKYQDGVLTIRIHEIPPSQNAWKKWHWSLLAAEKDRWEQIIWAVVKQAGSPKFQKPVIQIKFYFPDNRRRDPSDNYMSWKAMTDGLSKAGVIEDDTWQVTRVLEPVVVIDRGNPHTEIIVKER